MFRLYRVIFRPSKTTDPIITRWSSALWDPQCLHNSIVTIQNHICYLIIILASIIIKYSILATLRPTEECSHSTHTGHRVDASHFHTHMNSISTKGGRFLELLTVSQAGCCTVSGRWAEHVACME